MCDIIQATVAEWSETANRFDIIIRATHRPTLTKDYPQAGDVPIQNICIRFQKACDLHAEQSQLLQHPRAACLAPCSVTCLMQHNIVACFVFPAISLGTGKALVVGSAKYCVDIFPSFFFFTISAARLAHMQASCLHVVTCASYRSCLLYC